jgi:putative OPT family oligopeptide transporter
VAEPNAETFQPYIPPERDIAEFTPRAILLGGFFGLLFGAVTVYVGLRAGLTVAASIPIAVLSISILRVLGKATILENNIVQTTGSAGESIAGGVIFTLPALIFLGFPLEYARIFLLTLFGGWLGVFFMIPLRRQLIVKEHGNLLYPEGTACADVLIAGDRGGSFASRVFMGLGIGSLYTLFQNENMFAAWQATPTYNFGLTQEKGVVTNQGWFSGASFRANTTAEYLGVGYIIGPRISGIIFAGGVFAWLVVMPAIKFFGTNLTAPLYPGPKLIADMSPDELWRYYIRPIGAGAVAAAGLITLLKTIPTIIGALRAGLADLKGGAAAAASRKRTDDDLPMSWALAGAGLVLVMMWAMLTFKPVPGAQTSVFANIAAAVFVVIFGFLFVTVSSRITGLIGTSANPISGMAIATLMATCAVFLMLGWTGAAFSALAISIGGVVCIASANAGNTSQDLKTGFLVGATPRRQQVALLVGVMVSVVAIGFTLMGMNIALESYRPFQQQIDIARLPQGVEIQKIDLNPTIRLTDEKGKLLGELQGAKYQVLNAIGARELPDGKYLYNPETKQIEVQWISGIGSERAAAPQARLMATVINGILNQRLPWGLVLLGVFIVVAVELLGIRSLSFAVGFYLSIATTMAIFTGGLVRYFVERAAERAGEKAEESDVSPGSLYASGLIAAGGIVGLLGIAVKLMEDWKWIPEKAVGWGNKLPWMGDNPTPLGHWIGVVTFIALAYSAFHYARKPLDTGTK